MGRVLRRYDARTPAVALATGLSQTTISLGLREMQQATESTHLEPGPDWVRSHGVGRKSTTSHNPSFLAGLKALVDPVTRGARQSTLRWTCKSTRKLAEALQQWSHRVGYRTVASLLCQLGDSL